MNPIDYRAASYITSIYHLQDLPKDDVPEVAFVGRSNVGKSSVLNTLTGQKKLARTSKTPGRTQCINLFAVPPHARLADLPGYGFAKVPPKMQEHWEKLLSSYLASRENLRGLVILMDIRHPLTPLDQQMIKWCQHYERSLHLLLTKADKLSRSAGLKTLQEIQKSLAKKIDPSHIQLFSSLQPSGVDLLERRLNEWLT